MLAAQSDTALKSCNLQQTSQRMHSRASRGLEARHPWRRTFVAFNIRPAIFHQLSRRIRSLADPDQSRSSASTTQQVSAQAFEKSSPPVPVPGAEPSRNTSLLGGAAVAFGAAIFVATRLLNAGPSLASLESNTVSLDQALSNGRPTVLEFYASWCEVCRELVPTEYDVQQNYKDRVNFVMLNIDNIKWAPEVSEYRVRGIPHFVFLDESGKPLSAAVGRLPAEVLDGNTNALAQHKPLPYTGVREQASSLDSVPASSLRSVGPRDHA